jgi:hypothetical protein
MVIKTQLPAAIAAKVSGAALPENYRQAKRALAECERVDEARAWSDRAAAIASYARQAKDDELENHARRIRARAVRRMGELLLNYDARGGDRSKNATPPIFAPPSRAQAAAAAGVSKHESIQATRIASLPSERFEAAIEARKVPGSVKLAQMARPKRVDANSKTLSLTRKSPAIEIHGVLSNEDLRTISSRNRAKDVIQSLLKIEQAIDVGCGLDAVFERMTDEPADNRRKIAKALNFLDRLKDALDGARPPHLRSVN